MGRLTRLVLPVSKFDLKKGTSLFSPPLFFLSPSAVRNTSIPLIYFNRFPNNSGSQKWLSLLEKKLDYHHLNLVISDNSPRQDIPDLFISRHSFQLWILKKEEKKRRKKSCRATFRYIAPSCACSHHCESSLSHYITCQAELEAIWLKWA